MQTLLIDNIGYLNKQSSNYYMEVDIKKIEPKELKLISDLFKVSIDYLCFEDLNKISKKERLDNYNLVQKRLKL